MRRKSGQPTVSGQSTVDSEQFAVSSLQSPIHHHHSHIAPPYWFEVGLEPTFLYAAAIQTNDPAPPLPPSLAQRQLYVRLLPSIVKTTPLGYDVFSFER